MLAAQDPRTKPKAMLKLLEASEKAKKQLSPVGVTDAPMNIECLWEDVSVVYVGVGGTRRIDRPDRWSGDDLEALRRDCIWNGSSI